MILEEKFPRDMDSGTLQACLQTIFDLPEVLETLERYKKGKGREP